MYIYMHCSHTPDECTAELTTAVRRQAAVVQTRPCREQLQPVTAE